MGEDVYENSERRMFITIAICTLNRAESLRRTLASLAAMHVPDDLDWEVVVVNNNSADATDDVISSFAGRLPIRREFEMRRGLSSARNRAVDSATGKYIIWTDDDVIVDPNWIATYAQAFRQWPGAAVFAGPVIPRYSEPVPKWIADSKAILEESVFAGCNFGDHVRLLSDELLPWGPNFALRSTEQRACRYNLDLGHAPGRWRRGEEIDVVERIMKSGASGYWVPQAKVEHLSNATQQTHEYVARYFQTHGETIAFVEGHRGAPMWLGVPRWALRQLAQAWLGYRVHRLFSAASVWVPHMKDYYTARGVVRHWRRVRRRGAQSLKRWPSFAASRSRLFPRE
jgi:glycosyltransferase involved in cell wall biosynthesis